MQAQQFLFTKVTSDESIRATVIAINQTLHHITHYIILTSLLHSRVTQSTSDGDRFEVEGIQSAPLKIAHYKVESKSS